MTREQLDAIRARVQDPHKAALDSEVVWNTLALLAEVERLTKLTEETEAQMHLRIRAGYDKTVADSWRAWAEKQRAAAFRRGVAAMREAAATHVAFGAHPSSPCGRIVCDLANEVRELPDPEDKP